VRKGNICYTWLISFESVTSSCTGSKKVVPVITCNHFPNALTCSQQQGQPDWRFGLLCLSFST
jgi:hypothetical protein